MPTRLFSATTIRIIINSDQKMQHIERRRKLEASTDRLTARLVQHHADFIGLTVFEESDCELVGPLSQCDGEFD